MFQFVKRKIKFFEKNGLKFAQRLEIWWMRRG
jgi:hypothetical protein